MKKLQNSKKNALYKAHTQTKKVLVIVLVSFFSLLLIGNVSAMDWDNVKSYDADTKTVTVINALNLPLISYDIAKIRLVTPLNYEVPRGYQKVAEFELYDFEKDYKNAFKDMNFYQVNNNLKEFERDFDYKYLDYVNEEQAIYGEVCENKYVNGTIQEVCKMKEIDKKIVKVPVWIKFNDINELPSNQDNFIIGIFTVVEKGDKVEWIPTFFGVKINEWAQWTENLDVGLITYYPLNETSGVVLDVHGNNNGTNYGATRGVPGIINNSFDFDGDNDYVDTNYQGIDVSTNKTINLWMKTTTSGTEMVFGGMDGATDRILFPYLNNYGANSMSYHAYNGANGYVVSITNSTLFDGNWHMISVVQSGITSNHVTIYADGNNHSATIQTSGTLSSATVDVNLYFGAWNNAGAENFFDGNIDEMGLWSRALSTAEILELYVSGGYFGRDVYPIITLNTPIDTFNTTNQTIVFNGSVIDLNGVANVSLYIDGILNETNSSGVNDTDYIFTKILDEGAHNWTYEACDNGGKCGNATVRDLIIDFTAPVINITYPTDTIHYYIINTNLTLNWSVFDLSLDSCWYNYNGTNISVDCSDNHTNINITDYSNRNVTFYVNDTLGFLSSDYQEWNYTIFETLKTYNSSSFETESETFWINITTNGITPTSAKLIYNGTSYSADITNTVGNYYNVSRTIDIPTGIGNKTFFFNFTVSGTEISSSVQTQLINLTNFTYCTTGTPFINITFKNETILEEDITAAISSTWNYWLGSGTVSKTLSFSDVSENPNYEFCLIGINKTLGTNVSLLYSNSISQQRNFAGSFTLTNVTTNQTLYLLPTAEGLYITFQVINIAEQPIPNVFSNVTKAGVLVGSGTTDDAGTISYFLDPDSSYVFTFFKSGYDIYVTTLTPTQTTFTITLGAEEVVEEDDYTRGITYSISPGAVSLVNDTNTYFNFTLTSTYWDVEEFGFNLTNQDGDLLDSVSASTNGGTVFILQNTTNDTTITMTFFWTIEGNISSGSTFWAVVDSSGAGFGLTTFFTHLTAYLNTEMFGLNTNSMIILIYIIIFITTGVMSFKYGITSPTAISLMIFGLVFLFEVHLGWIPSISNFPILTILFAIVSIALILKGELR